MLCRKAKNTEGKDVARKLLHHPLKMSLPPPGRNPETAPDKPNFLNVPDEKRYLINRSPVEFLPQLHWNRSCRTASALPVLCSLTNFLLQTRLTSINQYIIQSINQLEREIIKYQSKEAKNCIIKIINLSMINIDTKIIRIDHYSNYYIISLSRNNKK